MLDRQVTNSTAIWPLSCWHGASSAISSNPCFLLQVVNAPFKHRTAMNQRRRDARLAWKQRPGALVGQWPRRATDPPQTPPTNQAFCSQHAAGERSAAPPSPPFCTSAPTAVRQCPLGSVLAGEQPDSSRSAAVSRSERSAQATRPPLAALATDLIASLISRPSASKLSMMDIVDREADAERPRGG